MRWRRPSAAQGFHQGVQGRGLCADRHLGRGRFSLLPVLSVLTILGLYSLYLFYLGLPVLMRTPPERAIGYVFAVIVCAIDRVDSDLLAAARAARHAAVDVTAASLILEDDRQS